MKWMDGWMNKNLNSIDVSLRWYNLFKWHVLGSVIMCIICIIVVSKMLQLSRFISDLRQMRISNGTKVWISEAEGLVGWCSLSLRICTLHRFLTALCPGINDLFDLHQRILDLSSSWVKEWEVRLLSFQNIGLLRMGKCLAPAGTTTLHQALHLHTDLSGFYLSPTLVSSVGSYCFNSPFYDLESILKPLFGSASRSAYCTF